MLNEAEYECIDVMELHEKLMNMSDQAKLPNFLKVSIISEI